MNRPPTTAQRDAYNAGRPRIVPKLSHGTKKPKSKKAESQLVNPVWRPFSHDKLLSQVRREIHYGKDEKDRSGNNQSKGQTDGTTDKTPR